MKNGVKKIFAAFLLLTIILILGFFYELLSASGNVFSQNRSGSASVARQLSDMIINPSKSVKGEERGQINILLMGIGGAGHPGGQLTDTIIIASLRPQTHEAALLSIPRDLYVEVKGTDIKSKINAVKEIGDMNNAKNGIELLKQATEDVSGLHIDYYAQLDFNGFIKIVDTIGGIDIYLENDINDPAYPDFNYGYDPFYIEKGWHHLDGATALKVARSRHSTMGDFDRIKRQQEIIKAFKQKAYEKYSSADILALREIFLSLSENLKTDVEMKDLPRFYEIVKEIRANNLTAQTIDTQKYLQKTDVGLGYALGSKSGDFAQVNELGKNIFNMQIPEDKAAAIQKENALIAIKNATKSPSTANQIARDLENMGFKIASSSNIENIDLAGVEIDYLPGNEKSETLNFLANKFSAKTEVKENLESNADFVIILGKGF